MKLDLNRLADKLCRREKTVLIIMILAFVAVVGAVCFWKYRIFAYDGLDLAIYNQVIWNMLHGRFFESSIQTHSYLGDHAELALPLLIPFYAVWPDPRMLLLLQAVALALPVWPLWLIAKRRLAGSRLPRNAAKVVPLTVALAYLISPFVHNAALFEFHMLPFALLPLFLALLEYEKGRKIRFLAFAILALLVREDIALILGAVGLLAWLERRPLFWRLTPLLLSGAWFLAALKLIARFAPAGGYKFSIYYTWLGDTPAEMVWTILRHPLRLLAHVLTLPNLEMILGFALPFMFIIFLRPKRLILAVGPLLQFVLGAPGGGEIVLQLHYAALFLPALFLAFIEGFQELPELARRLRARGVTDPRLLLAMILVTGAIYCNAVLSPLPAAATRLIAPADDMAARLAAAEELLARVPPDSPVAASYVLLPRLSSRERLYSLHYAFLGTSQFGLTPYELPPDNRFVALDTADLPIYQAQSSRTAWAAPHYSGGYARLRAVAGPLVFSRDAFHLYDKLAAADGAGTEPPPRQTPRRQNFAAGIRLPAAETRVVADGAGRRLLELTAVWSADMRPKYDLVTRLRLLGPDGRIAIDRVFPLTNGLVPATELGAAPVPDRIVLDLSGLAPGDYLPLLTLEKQEAGMVLNGIRSTDRLVTRRESYGGAQLRPFRLE